MGSGSKARNAAFSAVAYMCGLMCMSERFMSFDWSYHYDIISVSQLL